MLDEIAEWLLVIEKVARPFKRFVDFSRLTTVAVRTRHVFEFARKRREQFAGVALCAQRCFPTTGSASAIACIYESLVEETPIEARAFRDRRWAAEWLSVPVYILTLKDEPVPHVESRAPKHS